MQKIVAKIIMTVCLLFVSAILLGIAIKSAIMAAGCTAVLIAVWYSWYQIIK